MAVEQLRQNAQAWSDIANLCGGLIALHKCNWHLIAWEYLAGHLTMVTSTSEQIIMHDCHGSLSCIMFLPPDQPNVGLSFRLCPNGDQLPHFTHLWDAVQRVCRSASSAHLNKSETRLHLWQCLLPKISYALHGTSFSTKQCSQINSVIWFLFSLFVLIGAVQSSNIRMMIIGQLLMMPILQRFRWMIWIWWTMS